MKRINKKLFDRSKTKMNCEWEDTNSCDTCGVKHMCKMYSEVKNEI